MPGCLTTTAQVRQKYLPCRSLTANHNLETMTKRDIIWEGLTTQFLEASSSSEGTAAYSRHTFLQDEKCCFFFKYETHKLNSNLLNNPAPDTPFSVTAQWRWSRFQCQLDNSCQIVSSYINTSSQFWNYFVPSVSFWSEDLLICNSRIERNHLTAIKRQSSMKFCHWHHKVTVT